jgi:hypothetical protein
MSNTVNVTLPLSVETLKNIITTPDSSIRIEYANSKFKGRAMLIYLTNIDVPIEHVSFDGVEQEDKFTLIDSYITHKSVVNIENLVYSAMFLLLTIKRVRLTPLSRQLFEAKSSITIEEVDAYLANAERAEHLRNLLWVMDNIMTYTLTRFKYIEEALGKIEDYFTVVNDVDITGFTFVNMLRHDFFVEQYFSVPSNIPSIYFKQQFDEAIYNGKTLYDYVDKTFLLPIFNHTINTPSFAEETVKVMAAALEMQSRYQ